MSRKGIIAKKKRKKKERKKLFGFRLELNSDTNSLWGLGY